jgi:hypothetical protein
MECTNTSSPIQDTFYSSSAHAVAKRREKRIARSMIDDGMAARLFSFLCHYMQNCCAQGGRTLVATTATFANWPNPSWQFYGAQSVPCNTMMDICMEHEELKKCAFCNMQT